MAAILHPYRLVPTMSRQPGSEVVRSIMRGGIRRLRMDRVSCETRFQGLTRAGSAIILATRTK